jgi:hypothetical protein
MKRAPRDLFFRPSSLPLFWDVGNLFCGRAPRRKVSGRLKSAGTNRSGRHFIGADAVPSLLTVVVVLEAPGWYRRGPVLPGGGSSSNRWRGIFKEPSSDKIWQSQSDAIVL